MKRSLDRAFLGMIAETPAIALCIMGGKHLGLSTGLAILLMVVALLVNNLEMSSRKD